MRTLESKASVKYAIRVFVIEKHKASSDINVQRKCKWDGFTYLILSATYLWTFYAPSVCNWHNYILSCLCPDLHVTYRLQHVKNKLYIYIYIYTYIYIYIYILLIFYDAPWYVKSKYIVLRDICIWQACMNDKHYVYNNCMMIFLLQCGYIRQHNFHGLRNLYCATTKTRTEKVRCLDWDCLAAKCQRGTQWYW